MASSGIRRKVDDLGRVVIPAGIRRTLGIREGDPVEVTVEGERVVLAKPQDSCVFCGREEDSLTDFRGRLVCRDCLASLGAVAERRRATSDAVARSAGAPARGPADLPAWDEPPHRPAPAATPAATPPVPVPTSRPPNPPEDPAGPAPQETQETQEPVPGTQQRTDTPDPAPSMHRPHVGPQPRAEGTEEDDEATRPPRPPYDPASTTAW
jgi:AbrB family transcriptional regulator, transcriptional pleiotropic regulator of transition state genes